MSTRTEIIESLLNKTYMLTKKFGNIYDDAFNELVENYFSEKVAFETQMSNAESWGGNVWDHLYHGLNITKLISNHEAHEDKGHSPKYIKFPYEKLNKLAIKAIQDIQDLLEGKGPAPKKKAATKKKTATKNKAAKAVKQEKKCIACLKTDPTRRCSYSAKYGQYCGTHSKSHK